MIRDFIKQTIEGSVHEIHPESLPDLRIEERRAVSARLLLLLPLPSGSVREDSAPGVRALDKCVPESRREAFRSLFAYPPDRYHAKVIPLNDAKKIVTLERDVCVSPETSKKVIPFETVNQWVSRVWLGRGTRMQVPGSLACF